MSLNFDAMASRVQRNRCAVRGHGAPVLLDRFYDHMEEPQAERRLVVDFGRSKGRAGKSGNKILAGEQLLVHDLVYRPRFTADSKVERERDVKLDYSGKRLEPRPQRAMGRFCAGLGTEKQVGRLGNPAARHIPTTTFGRQISRDQRARSASSKRDKERALHDIQNALNPLHVKHKLVDATVAKVPNFARGTPRNTLPHHRSPSPAGFTGGDSSLTASMARPASATPVLNASGASHVQHLSRIGDADLSFFTTEATADITAAFEHTSRPIVRSFALGPGYRPPPTTAPAKAKKLAPFRFGGPSPTRDPKFRHPALAADQAAVVPPVGAIPLPAGGGGSDDDGNGDDDDAETRHHRDTRMQSLMMKYMDAV